jgi:hypothetical protein
MSSGQLSLRNDVFAGDFPDEVGMIVSDVPLRVLPKLVVVVTLDDQAAHAVDPHHGCQGYVLVSR